MDRVVCFDGPRVERTVTRKFVCSHLLPDEIENLDIPLAFGDGLTNCTYWDWIQEKARRLFLILVDIGVPDQIFGIVDDSWEDDDLPIPLDHIDRLALTATKDPKLDRKFYSRQFFYIPRKLQRDQHLDYQDDEFIPLDVAEKRLTHNQAVDRVELPGFPGKVFCRRRFSLGQEPGCLTREEFMYNISSIQSFQNDHMVTYWASYTYHGHGYILFTPVGEYKLSSFLANNLSSVKNLDKMVKRRMVLDWIHCLVDTLSFIHSRGMSLGTIKPSMILFTHDHHIFFPDTKGLGSATAAGKGNNSFDKESYDYAAPEQWFKSSKPLPGIRGQTATERSSFAISRGGGGGGPEEQASASPQLNPQAVDIFSLGCIILELLSYGLLKRSTSAFASHRAAKHKSAGRGGAILDSSFHKNLGQVEKWMSVLAKDATKKANDDTEKGRLFQAVSPLLHVVQKMLATHPAERPSAAQVQGWVYPILTDLAGITEPHCVHNYDDDIGGGWDSAAAAAATADRPVIITRPSTTVSRTADTTPSSTYLGVDIPSDRDDMSDLTGITMAGSSSYASKRSSLFGLNGRAHRRHPSQESLESKFSTHSNHQGERWEMGSGLKAIQSLRITGKTKSWQTLSQAGSTMSSNS